MKGTVCPNCFSKRVKTLEQTDGVSRRLTMSDGQRLDQVAVQRLLCTDCACVSIAYDPPGRMRDRFRRELNPGGHALRESPIAGGGMVSRRQRVASSLWTALPVDLPTSGNWLEIGCGRGGLSAAFLARHPGWTCHAVDPSPGASLAVRRADEEIHFDRRFDVIAAHGLLNRSPIWPELVKMRALAHRGTWLSLDVLVLENSVFAPHVWDYSCMFPREVLRAHLIAAGFAIRHLTDCGSSLHVLAECVARPDAAPPRPGGNQVALAQSLMQKHSHWWENLVRVCRRELDAGGECVLYGAGLFNSILLSFVAPSNFVAVIDELRAGRNFHGLPVIVPGEAARRNLRALVCARPQHLQRMVDMARRVGVSVTVLGEETAVG